MSVPRSARASIEREIALVDLVDRLLGEGVVISGDITLAVADVDLVYVGLRALVSSVASAERMGLLAEEVA
jgi:Gas vesicle protein